MRLLPSVFLIYLVLCINSTENQRYINNVISRRNRTARPTTTTTTASSTTNVIDFITNLTTESARTITTRASITNDENNRTCVPASINDFPTDLFTQRQRRFGCLIFHLFFIFYLFVAITKLCDEYFINSLEFISKRFNLDEDVAGATFMAAGSSAPEVFISLIGVFVTEADVGIGTIVGSAVFNILFVIGICALFVNATSKLSIWPFFRDSIFYILSIVVLIAFIRDNRVYWYESLIMLMMYGFYILFMTKNEQIKKKCIEKFKILQHETHTIIPDSKNIVGNGQFGGFMKSNAQAESGYTRFDDDDQYAWGGTTDSFTGLQNNNSYQNSYNLSRLEVVEQAYHDSIKNADESIATRKHKIEFDTAVLHIMLDRHSFKRKTRFRMAVRLVIDEITWIKRNPNTEKTGHPRHLYQNKRNFSNYLLSSETKATNEKSESNYALSTKLGYYNGIGGYDLLKCIFYAPMNFIFFFSIPDCKLEKFKTWYMLTFFMSIFWMAILSYFMVWMVTVIGFTIGIPDSIMGITFLAAGTSIPDAYSSIVVVKQGYVDMGVSNIFGSNVFDLLIGLAVPWFIKAIFSKGYITINSNGLVYDSIMLFSCVAFTIAAIHFRRWHLDRRIGYVFLSVYAAFIIFSSAIELNLFAYVNPPVC